MVTPELLRFVYQFNQWADRRTIDTCATLTNEQFTRDLGSSFGSIRDTLAHMYGAEWVWNERMEGRSPASFPESAAFPDLASVSTRLESMDRHYVDLTSKLTEQDLQRSLRYKTFAGAEFSNPLWQTLHHLSNHGTYHRGQIATMLRQLGSKAAPTDMIGYYREQAASANA